MSAAADRLILGRPSSGHLGVRSLSRTAICQRHRLCRSAARAIAVPAAVNSFSDTESALASDGASTPANLPLDPPAETGVSLEAYTALKDKLMRRTKICGAFLVTYLGLVASVQAASCGAAGACGSWLYLSLVIQDCDKYTAATEPPLKAAKGIKFAPLRNVALTAAAYKQSLRPRLLVPVGLFAAFTAYRSLIEPRMGLVEAAALLAGFLSYKGALVLVLWDDNKPNFGMGGKARHDRPRLVQFPRLEDEEDEEE
ncbi:hypothetical protein WJX73_002707 [Symbiochloris irregularis]|uniref:Uncharacterized protein n=1 Tax=Symbiochloris irregularis TaxID=706552 RepID=A0AAW1PYM1_9CHLO